MKISKILKTDEVMIKTLFNNIKKGDSPKFGSPETKCDKCMFLGIACFPSPEYIGCLGGWKREV